MLALPPNDSIAREPMVDTRWLRYFNTRQAIAAVAAHVEQLPGSRTPERHTWRSYSDGLNYFLSWSNNHLPTEDLMVAFVAHLIKQRGLKSATVANKYLTPIRLYLRKLAGQRIAGYSGIEREYIADCRDHIRAAADIKSPRADTSTNIAPLWDPKFKRLSLQQVNAVLRAVDRSSRLGLRDYALLHVAFSTGLRLAELARISLAAISQQHGIYLIAVRGKRSNYDPVPISASAYSDLMAYVEAYNAGLASDDQRIIAGEMKIWQPMLHGDNYAVMGVNRYHPNKGLSAQGIRDIIARRTTAALGPGMTLAAHDTRRTAAALAYDAGMKLTDIQALLRHKDAAVTLRYIGTKPDYGSRMLAGFVSFG